MSDTHPTPPPTQNSPGRAEDSASPDSTASTALPTRVPALSPTRVGRYEIRQVLGEGAFGRVYRAFDPELHREVAIKLPNAQTMTPELRERFLREARAAATIHHPNVCPIHDVGTDADGPFIVMHFIAGGTLDGLLKSRKRPFSGLHAAAIVRKIALGVAAAHAKGVLHRDLKPANVLWDDVNREVLVTDFGLARIGNAAQISKTGEILGTPAYMSPEQARGRQDEIGPLTDVYSLGVILYRTIAGRVPFEGTVMEVLARAQFDEPAPPSSVRPELDSDLDTICLKAIAKRPEDRYASARDFADALEDYLRSKKENRHRREVIEPNPPVSSLAVTTGTSDAASPVLPSTPQIEELRDSAGGTDSIECPACNARLVMPAGIDRSARCPYCKATFSIVEGQDVAMLELSDAVPPPATPPFQEFDWQDAPEPVEPIRVIDWNEAEERELADRERSRDSLRLARRRVRRKASGCLDFSPAFSS